ncbi:MAG: hypothetical protein V3S82_01305 [Dehalococcoidia bacterium]
MAGACGMGWARLLGLGAVLMAVGLLGSSLLLATQALKVTARVTDMPPGIMGVAEKRGSPPPGIVRITGGGDSVLYVNTDIDFGTIFPGETGLRGKFTVFITGVPGSGPPWTDPETPTAIAYSVALNGAGTLSPFIRVVKDPAEADTETDPLIDPPGDFTAGGSLDDTASPPDTSDVWWVILDEPVEDLGDYAAEITVDIISGAP